MPTSFGQKWKFVGRRLEVKSEQGSEFGPYEEMVVLLIDMDWIVAAKVRKVLIGEDKDWAGYKVRTVR